MGGNQFFRLEWVRELYTVNKRYEYWESANIKADELHALHKKKER